MLVGGVYEICDWMEVIGSGILGGYKDRGWILYMRFRG